MLGAIIAWFVIGIIAGAIARLLVPGRDPMGCLATAALGVGGAYLGGFLSSLLFRGEFEVRPANLIGAVIGAVILLLLLRRVRR